LLNTSLGEIEIELDQEKAPISVRNFLEYVDSGFYDGTIFHRVIPGFMIQGGGFDAQMRQKPTSAPIRNQADSGPRHARGTSAMVHGTSATPCSARWCAAWAWSTRSPRCPPATAACTRTFPATRWRSSPPGACSNQGGQGFAWAGHGFEPA